MTIKAYRKKRQFSKTPEPIGRRTKSKRTLRFVVQKHHASNLHYDFRLELEGVLKSWAIPKGPSLNPSEKRLAVQVEDHPIEYSTFEGNIPDGEYGAGSVIVWDTGTWKIQDEGNIENGKIKFTLRGEKLKGHWTLIRMGSDINSKNWLLIKEADKYASTENILAIAPNSVKSGISLEALSLQSRIQKLSRKRK